MRRNDVGNYRIYGAFAGIYSRPQTNPYAAVPAAEHRELSGHNKPVAYSGLQILSGKHGSMVGKGRCDPRKEAQGSVFRGGKHDLLRL